MENKAVFKGARYLLLRNRKNLHNQSQRDQLNELFLKIKTLGLTPKEYQNSREVILAKVRPKGITTPELDRAVTGPVPAPALASK